MIILSKNEHKNIELNYRNCGSNQTRNSNDWSPYNVKKAKMSINKNKECEYIWLFSQCSLHRWRSDVCYWMKLSDFQFELEIQWLYKIWHTLFIVVLLFQSFDAVLFANFSWLKFKRYVLWCAWTRARSCAHQPSYGYTKWNETLFAVCTRILPEQMLHGWHDRRYASSRWWNSTRNDWENDEREKKKLETFVIMMHNSAIIAAANDISCVFDSSRDIFFACTVVNRRTKCVDSSASLGTVISFNFKICIIHGWFSFWEWKRRLHCVQCIYLLVIWSIPW